MKKGACITLVLLGWMAVCVGWPAGSEAQTKRVTLQLEWVVSGYHTGSFVAKERGFYAAKGLDVSISRGFGSGDTAKVVASGTVDFGMVNIPTAIIARGRGAPIVALAVFTGKAPESFLAFEEKGIRKPKDVEGKTFGEAPGGATMVVWPAFAKLAGIDISKTTHIAVEPATKPAMFFGGRVDWTFGFRPGFDEVIILRARREGKKLVFIRWEDYGWKVYNSGLFTHDEVLKRDPKLVADFVSATLQGYRWTVENPDQALEIFLKANPEVDREAARLSLMFGLDGLLTKVAREGSLGYLEADRMAFQIDLMSKTLNLPPPKAEEMYTNRFIQKKPLSVPPALEAELAKLR